MIDYFDKFSIELTKRRDALLKQLEELEENYELVYHPSRIDLTALLKLKEQIDDSLTGNQIKDFKNKQLNEIEDKIGGLRKNMEIDIKLICKDYLIDSISEKLDQIKIEVTMASPVNGFDSTISFSSTCATPELGPIQAGPCNTLLKPAITACSKGAKSGELNNPRGIAVDDSSARIYIADYGNNRIQVFSYEGEYLSTFSDYHKTEKPYGLAVRDNSVFATMEGSHSIQHWTTDGKFVKKTGGKGSEIGKFKHPYGITVGASNTVYVCDNGNDRVQGFTAGLKHCISMGVGILYGPMDVKTSPDHLIVLDGSNQCLHLFGFDGDYLRSMLVRGIINQLANPWFFDVDSNGGILMTDSSKSVINLFSGEGELVKSIGGGGNGSVEFVFPTGIAIRSGNKPVCVFNKRNALLQIF